MLIDLNFHSYIIYFSSVQLVLAPCGGHKTCPVLHYSVVYIFLSFAVTEPRVFSLFVCVCVCVYVCVCVCVFLVLFYLFFLIYFSDGRGYPDNS